MGAWLEAIWGRIVEGVWKVTQKSGSIVSGAWT
jgi:hypothetical protein